MKILFTILAFSQFLLSSSQGFLNKGQVYDFNVGDLFQSKLTPNNYPPTFFTKKVLTKTFSSNNDTITYSIEDESYTLAACSTCNPVYNIGISNLVVTDLADSIIDVGISNIQAVDSTISVVDSEGVNTCNKNTRTRYQIPGPVFTLSALNIFGETYIEGCGGLMQLIMLLVEELIFLLILN
jgi:hypothetical protein